MTSTVPPFGKAMRREFLFADSYLPLNHGSYGTYPRSVHAAKLQWLELAEQRPDSFMRKVYMHELNKCRKLAAKAINAPMSDCVFVPNATTGVNEVLRGLEWSQGDTILYYSSVYGSCEKIVQFVCDTVPGLKAMKVDLEYPISNDEILALTQSALEKDLSVKVVLMDAISSVPGVRFPWERVCGLCRQNGIYSLVDGAHAITQIPVDITESQPDFFVSNLHKWSYVPRGCAVLYVRTSLQPFIHSMPIGHGYVSPTQPFIPSPHTPSTEGQWVTEHEWVGTVDWSGYLSVGAAFEFIERCGGAEKIRDYCHGLAVEGGKRAAEILGTEVLRDDGGEHTANMVNVRLPLDIPDKTSTTFVEQLNAQRDSLVDRLFEKDCFVYPFLMRQKGKQGWWCRISAQIYLDLDDFERGALILKKICEDLQT